MGDAQVGRERQRRDAKRELVRREQIPLMTASALSTAPTPTATASGAARLRRTAPFAVANRTSVATGSAIAKPNAQPVPGRTAASTDADVGDQDRGALPRGIPAARRDRRSAGVRALPSAAGRASETRRPEAT